MKLWSYVIGVTFFVASIQPPSYAYQPVQAVTLTATAVCGTWPNSPGGIQSGWKDASGNPKAVSVPLKLSPIVGDIRYGNGLEVVAAGYDEVNARSTVYLWDYHGEDYSNWPQQIPEAVESLPALGDLNNDFHLEIVVPGSSRQPGVPSKLYIYQYAGNQLYGWPQSVNRAFIGPPVVIDINEDDIPEVFALVYDTNGTNAQVYGWNDNGTLLSGWPVDLDSNIVSNVIAVADLGNDGEYEVVATGSNKVYVFKEDGTSYTGWPNTVGGANVIGAVVLGDLDNNSDLEIIVPASLGGTSYIYSWHHDGSIVTGWPVTFTGNYGTGPGAEDYLSLGDLDNDYSLEVISSSVNGYVGAWHADGTVMEGAWPVYIPPDQGVPVSLYKPIVANIDNDEDANENSDLEILCTSNRGRVYVWNEDGSSLAPWPYEISGSPDLSAGCTIADIDGPDGYNDDIELLFGTTDNHIYVIGTGGYFDPNTCHWMAPRYNFRNIGGYVNDNHTLGWSVFDNEPPTGTAPINSIYDWTRGTRIIKFQGAGISNGYKLCNPDGSDWVSKRINIRWALNYTLFYMIFVSVDTLEGKRYLYYTPEDYNLLEDPLDPHYIHHGLGWDTLNGKWQTIQRNLLQDLKDAQPTNEIIKVNAFYVRGTGSVDDIVLIPPESTAELPNLAPDASVTASSELLGYEAVKVIDGQVGTGNEWASNDPAPWIRLSWNPPITVNKIILHDRVGLGEQVTSGELSFSWGSNISVGVLPNDGTGLEITFPKREDISWIQFNILTWIGTNPGLSEFEVYYDPNLEEIPPPRDLVYSTETYIRMENNLFWNPLLNEGAGGVWIPHGIAYQTWIQDLGVWQTPGELRTALNEMKAIGVDSLKVDFAWKHIEVADGDFDFSRYDLLLEECKVRGIKVFPLIGYQWPPEWWRTEHPDLYSVYAASRDYPNWDRSETICYEHQEVQTEFAEYLQEVVGRYSIGGYREDLADTVITWILGNEYGYLELWSGRYMGYDETSIKAFREWLRDKYNNNINALNDSWKRDNEILPGYLPNLGDVTGPNWGYACFTEDDPGYQPGYPLPDMPTPYGPAEEVHNWEYSARDKASWYDLTQWREESIANFIAKAARAVKDVPDSQMITYSAVGMQWGEEDWRYHVEDARKIVQACQNIGAPLDFWSINNYPWGMRNNELMTGQWGIARAKHDTGLPVMISETGFTSTETMYPGIDEARQALLLRNALWETLECGAIGIQLFTWQERDSVPPRERGFGIVKLDEYGEILEYKPAYYSVRDTYNLIDSINVNIYDSGTGQEVTVDLGDLLNGSQDPTPDIAFLWDDATDSIINRYEAEMNQLFGTLERLGFEPYFINREELLNGNYQDYKAIVLPRNQKMFGDTFDLLDDIVGNGVKLHANADLPGIMDEYSRPRNEDGDWIATMSNVFGIDTSANCRIDPDLEDSVYYDGYETPSGWLRWMHKGLEFLYIGYNAIINMWKYRDLLSVTTGTTLATFDNNNPALVMNMDRDAAISLFSLGDSKSIDNAPYSDWTWENRYDWLKVIYKDPVVGFGLEPELNISLSKLVLVDYRICPHDTVLLSFKNYQPDQSETVRVGTALIIGKTVESLISGTIIEENSDGIIDLTLDADEHDLLLAYNVSGGGKEEVLVIVITTLPNGTEGEVYGVVLQATGGVLPYNWSIEKGSLPAGLSLSSTGVINGTPEQGSAGDYTFTVRVTDAVTSVATRQFTLTIDTVVDDTKDDGGNDNKDTDGDTPDNTDKTGKGSPDSGSSSGLDNLAPDATAAPSSTVSTSGSESSTPANIFGPATILVSGDIGGIGGTSGTEKTVVKKSLGKDLKGAKEGGEHIRTYRGEVGGSVIVKESVGSGGLSREREPYTEEHLREEFIETGEGPSIPPMQKIRLAERSIDRSIEEKITEKVPAGFKEPIQPATQISGFAQLLYNWFMGLFKGFGSSKDMRDILQTILESVAMFFKFTK